MPPTETTLHGGKILKKNLKGGFAADDMKHDLVEKIKSGELQPGEKILSERKLAISYGISYMTVRRAIDALVKEGYVSREPHRGLFVSKKFRSISTVRNRTIAFVASELSGEVMSSLLCSIEQRARQYGYFVIVCNSVLDVTIERAALENIRHTNISGVIIHPINSIVNKAAALSLVNSGIPVVAIDDVYTDVGIDSVTCDNVDIAYKAVSHLIRNGHTNIAHITVSMENFRHNRVAQKRMEGFRNAMREHDLPILPGNITYLPWEYTSLPINEIDMNMIGYEQTLELLRRDNPPTAIFALFDEMAPGIYRAAAETGVRIPEDLSVIGVNNTDICDRLAPGLTTMAQPFKVIGLRAVDLLVMRSSEQTSGEIADELQGTLVQRGSVSAVRA